jgi:hypothetical protein
MSVVNGMLYKIVPFPDWFHLLRNCRHAQAVLIAATGWPQLAGVAGSVLALSAGLPGWNLVSATRRFAQHGGRFS